MSLQMVNEARINGKSEGNSLQLLMTALDYGLNYILLVSRGIRKFRISSTSYDGQIFDTSLVM